MNPETNDSESEFRALSEEECFDRLEILIHDKEAKRYAWLRHLLLLSSGSLSVLISLRAGEHQLCLPRYCVMAGVAALGLGILFGAVALHGEVWTARDLVVQMAKYKARFQVDRSEPFPGIFSKNPKRYRYAELACYISLVTAVFVLVVYTIVSR